MGHGGILQSKTLDTYTNDMGPVEEINHRHFLLSRCCRAASDAFFGAHYT